MACNRAISSASVPEMESDESKQSISVSKPLSLDVNGMSRRSRLFLWNLRTLPRRGLPSPARWTSDMFFKQLQTNWWWCYGFNKVVRGFLCSHRKWINKRLCVLQGHLLPPRTEKNNFFVQSFKIFKDKIFLKKKNCVSITSDN